MSGPLTRREFVVRAGGTVAWTAATGLRANATESAPPTVVLINESNLRRKYPKDIASLLAGLEQFAARQNAHLLFVSANAAPKDIKALLLKHAPRPQRLLIFGDDEVIPRLKINWKDYFVYFFKGDQYVRYDLRDESFSALKPIAGNWPGLPAAWRSHPRTALSWLNNTVYFMHGAEYVKYDLSDDTAGSIKPMIGNWRGLPAAWTASGIDAAINWGNGKAYFFRGGEYLGYDLASDRADNNYPRPMIPRHWPNWPSAWTLGIDAGVVLNNGKAYFFKGPKYLRYDIAGDRVDNGYPAAIAGHWRGLPAVFNSGIDFVFRAPGEELPVDYFYGDLDGDGLSEVATSRILGSPQTMLRQLGTTSEATTPHTLILNAEPRESVEANQMVTTSAGRGCTFEAIDHADVQALTRADLIHLCGHGNPEGWYGTGVGAYVTASTVPDLPRHPVIFAGACSTATPGAPILRAFMDKGCRSYVGAASDSYGMTPGYLGNELFLHFIEALRGHPDWTVMQLVAEARTRFVRVNGLAPLLLRLEKGEYPSDVNDALVNTGLQFQVFGDPTARFPQSPRPSNVARRSLASQPVALKTGDVVPIRYDIRPADGLTTLSLRAEWDRDVSANLEIEIIQNGEPLHRLDWKEQREYWAYADTRAGGYWDAGRYQALALVPLKRRLGSNEAIVRVKRASKPVRLLPESEIQVWPLRNLKPPSQLTRRTGINLLWICYDDDAEPVRKALAAIEGAQFDRFDTFGDMRAPYEFPDEPGHLLELDRYDVIFIDYLWNGYRDIARGIAPKIRDFVKRGGGLIMAGGPASFAGKTAYRGLGGQGGFGGTPIEEALPVRITGEGDAVFAAARIGTVDQRHPITADLEWSSIPSVGGYNRLVAKPQATVLARIESRDPFLVVASYGKGRSAAIATSSSRKWGADFKKWSQYNRFWANLVRWAKG